MKCFQILARSYISNPLTDPYELLLFDLIRLLDMSCPLIGVVCTPLLED